MSDTLLVHGTTVAIGGHAVLLRGVSGSGKSDLALRLIDAGARLVADDRSELQREGDAIFARTPATIAGLIEARGVGILRVDPLAVARLSLIVDLVAPDAIERLPEPRSEAILGLLIPLIALAPFEASATAKLRFALDALAGDGTLARMHR
ncbi:MAG TPA: HPr kinase/phosphatase C-terminal domain-containing protein [Stellaceae bacterium]|nr:HPr kinase/phosphatase C-terminal domain-containing protein [Stellaceae bacterium]